MTDSSLSAALQDRYVLERELGHGGMATVYLARDLKHKRNQLAEAWNRNDPRGAVELFTDDAVYSAPPEGRVRRGHDELFRFFGVPPVGLARCGWKGTT